VVRPEQPGGMIKLKNILKYQLPETYIENGIFGEYGEARTAQWDDKARTARIYT
jgi:hypothetical protein